MSKLPQLELVLEEMRREYDQLSDSADKLDQKANWLLGSSSVVAGLFGVLQVPVLPADLPCLFWVGIALLALNYVGLVFWCIRVLAPRGYLYPIPAKWDVLSKQLIDVDIEAAYGTAISFYAEYIPRNRRFNEEKAGYVRVAVVLLCVLVVLVFALALFAR